MPELLVYVIGVIKRLFDALRLGFNIRRKLIVKLHKAVCYYQGDILDFVIELSDIHKQIRLELDKIEDDNKK